MASHHLMKMLDAAIGTPHDGTVNFRVLCDLLKAMIRKLGQQELPVLEPRQSPTPGLEKDQDTKAQPGQEEDRALGTGQQPQEPEEQLPGKDTLEGTRSNSKVTSMAKEAMPKRTEEEERNITKDGASLQDLWEEIKKFKEAHSGLAEDMRAMQEAHYNMAEDMRAMQQSLGLEGSWGQSAPAEPTQVDMDTQSRKSSALGPKGRRTQPGMKTSQGTPGSGSPGMQAGTQGEPVTPVKLSGACDASATTPGMQPGSPGTQASTSRLEPGSLGTQATTPLGTQPGDLGTQASAPGTQPGGPSTQATIPQGTQSGAPGTQAGTSRLEPGSPGTHTTAPGMQPGSPGSQATVPRDAQDPAMPWGALGSTSTSGHEAELREALCQLGQLGHLYAALKEQVEQLKEGKAERAELESLRRLFPGGGQESISSILANLRGQVSAVQGLARDLQEKDEKISQLENALGKLRIAGAGRKADDSSHITLPLGSTQQETKQELKGEHQETTKTSKQLHAEQLDEPRAPAESSGQEQAGCPICNSDTRVQVAKLLQRYEKLQELVESFMSQQTVGKMVRQLLGRSKQDEPLKHIQATVTQVQGDYKQLSSVLRNLLDDHCQEQKAIEALFQALGRLEKQKADKEELLLLGINEKADKAALADKVSRSQFEASVERLNEMIEEVTSRVMGQERDWHQFQQQLQGEMDSKLDRRELGLFRQQLEERWKSLRGQLQQKAPPQGDDAAGIRKQLLADFHCLSCDRPLNMLAPGPERTGECRYPTVLRSCGGPHTLTPPRFQPHLPSTPRRLPPLAQCPNKEDVMLLCQDGISMGRQDGQRPVLGDQAGFPRDNPELSLRQRNSPDTESSLSHSGTPSSPEHRPALSRGPASSLGHLSPAPGLLPSPQPHQNGSAP